MILSKDPLSTFIYSFEFEFDWGVVKFCQELKNERGINAFSFKHKKWRFNNLAIVDRIKESYPGVIITKDVEVDLVTHKLWKEAEVQRMSRSLELKNALETDFQVKNLTKELYGYQKVGVEFLINNKGRAVISDEMGCGKSCQALGYIAHEGFSKTVVVCPATAKGVWKSETKKFTGLKPFPISSHPGITLEDWVKHDIFLINYDILPKFLDFFKALKIDCLIADEVHKCKNPKSSRARAVNMLSRGIPHFIALSGTPLLNRPIELFTTLNMIDPIAWPDYYAYAKKYCGYTQGYWGPEFKGPTNTEELRGKISSYFLRRTKDQVLPYLPKRVYSEIPVELDSESAKEYADIEAGFITDLVSGEKMSVINALQQLSKLRQIASIGKIEAVIDHVKDLIETDKVIIFSCYNAPLRQLKEYFEDKAVYLTGETAQEDRDLAVKNFQEKEEVRVFLGGLKSASEAITLTAASITIFVDYDWVPATMEQGASRFHRPGVKHESLSIHQFVCPNTIDERMKKILEEKQKVFNDLFEKDPQKAHNYMVEALISSYKK